MRVINDVFKQRLLNKNIIYRFYSKKIDKHKIIYPFNLDKIKYCLYIKYNQKYNQKYNLCDFFKDEKYQ